MAMGVIKRIAFSIADFRLRVPTAGKDFGISNLQAEILNLKPPAPE